MDGIERNGGRVDKQRERPRIFLVGASGHAKVVADIVEREGLYRIAYLLDSNPALKGTEVYGYQVSGSEEEVLGSGGANGVEAGIVAIGSNTIRARVAAWLTERSFALLSSVHPSAQIGRGSTIGAGTVIMAGAIINSDCAIGDNVIINTKASVDHDCVIGDAVHVAPGATLCGTVEVGSGSFICAGATVLPNRRIGRNCIVGAGAVVVSDVPDGVTVVGCPAKPIIRS